MERYKRKIWNFLVIDANSLESIWEEIPRIGGLFGIPINLLQERSELILHAVAAQFETYRLLCLVPADSVYWDFNTDVREVVDGFYQQEEEFAEFIRLQNSVRLHNLPKALEKLTEIGVLDSRAQKSGLKAYRALVTSSEEIRRSMIFYPNTYGLNHRLVVRY